MSDLREALERLRQRCVKQEHVTIDDQVTRAEFWKGFAAACGEKAEEIRVLLELAAPPVPASGGQDGLRGEQMGAFDIWFDAYAKRTPKEHWSLRDAFETGKAFAESRILTATPSSAPASQPDAWTAARHWLLTDDTPNDIALEEGSRRIASLAKLLASRASQPEQTLRDVIARIEAFATQRDREQNPCSAQDIRACAILVREAQPEQTGRVTAEQASEILQHAADWHATQEAKADAMEYIGPMKYHEAQCKRLEAGVAALASPGSQPPEETKS